MIHSIIRAGIPRLRLEWCVLLELHRHRDSVTLEDFMDIELPLFEPAERRDLFDILKWRSHSADVI